LEFTIDVGVFDFVGPVIYFKSSAVLFFVEQDERDDFGLLNHMLDDVGVFVDDFLRVVSLPS
jgi:hypothetical protein